MISPEATKRLLAAMIERRADILAKLAQTNQQALFEAFRHLSPYAATIPDDDEKGLLALSQVIYSMLMDLRELDEVLPFPLLSIAHAKRRSGKATQKPSQHGMDIANQINIFVGQEPLAPSEIKGARLDWLESVLDRFFDSASS